MSLRDPRDLYWQHRNQDLDRIDEAAQVERERDLEHDHLDANRSLDELTRKRAALDADRAAAREQREEEALDRAFACRAEILDLLERKAAEGLDPWAGWQQTFEAIGTDPESIPSISQLRATVDRADTTETQILSTLLETFEWELQEYYSD